MADQRIIFMERILRKSSVSIGSERATRRGTRSIPRGYSLALLVVSHVLLGIMIYRSAMIATIHALICGVAGLVFALSGRSALPKVGFAAAYIVGSEVLWRMSHTPIFWEYGKLSITMIFIVALIRTGLTTFPPTICLYFVLLLPSAVLTIINGDPSIVRELLSYNLSGPLCLFASVCFFSQVKFTRQQFMRLFIGLALPVVSIATLTAMGVAMAQDIQFNTESNFATSGGFGPNQVSSVLGLGTLVVFLWLLSAKDDLKLKVLMFGVLLLMAVQSAMTFSRGGLYNALGALAVGTPFLLRDSGSRVKILLIATLLFLIGNYIILPRVNNFTGGKLVERFQETDTAGRLDIIQLDLEIMLENPVLGVGPGMAKEERAQMNRSVSAHTEFTRLLSEHGSLGVAALLMLLIITTQNLVQWRPPRERAIAFALTCWCFLYMLNAAMRLAAPGFVLGLSFLILERQRYQTGSKPERTRMADVPNRLRQTGYIART
jgi:hypothetical protein